jgi:REP element-mobilizing transposase RayT
MPPLIRYRRCLPHWRMAGSTYFVTWRLASALRDLTPLERSDVGTSLLRFDHERYTLFAYAVMNDHVHVLVRPHDGRRLEDLVHSWKSYTTHRLQSLGRRGKVWQEEYFDRIVRDDEEFLEKCQYIFNNPFKRWPGVQHYPWVWIRH